MTSNQVRKGLSSVVSVASVALTATIVAAVSLVAAYVGGINSDAYIGGANLVGSVLLAVSLALIATLDAQEKSKPEEEWRRGRAADVFRLVAAGMSVTGATLVVVAAVLVATGWGWQ